MAQLSHTDVDMSNDVRADKSDRANVAVLPPLILVAALALGFLIDFVFPVPLLPNEAALALGGSLVAVSIVVVLLAARELARARTTFDVRKPTTAIVSSGIFRISRNPVYLSMTLLQLGIAFLANSLWIGLLVIPLGSVLCLTVIRREERHLEHKFGSTYQSYRQNVRRWI
jgi:protein-S-isoprenylcysteine O-methyltransferase Ste14